MPWVHKDGRIIIEGKGWDKHPYNWSTAWSDADKKRMGLTWKKPSLDKEPFDETFYLGRKTDGTLIEKKLTDEIEKDKNGNIIAETQGLKSIWISRTKNKANNLLSLTDWYIIRASDDSSLAVPSDITAKRKAIRDASKTIEDKITACKTLADFIKLFDKPMKDGVPNGNPAIFDFPEE